VAKPETTADDDEPLSARWALILAIVFVLLMRELIPFGRTILYPFTLFATWVHEMGHGLTGLAVGGSFERLEIFYDASGLAHGSVGSGWPEAARAAGGLLGPPIVGAMILAASRGPKRSSIVLWILAAALAVSVPIWVRSLVGWVAVPAVALAIGALALRGGPTLRHLGAQILGVLLGLDTVSRIDYLFSGSARAGGEELPSDVAHIATALGGHYLGYGLILAAVSLVLVAIGLRIAWAEPLDLRLSWKKKGARRT
jgi:hypothetical protein